MCVRGEIILCPERCAGESYASVVLRGMVTSKRHSPSCLNNSHVLSHSGGGRRSEIQVSAEFASAED